MVSVATVYEPRHATKRLSGIRILIVDDDPDALELVTALLVHAGAELSSAFNADDGLLLLRHRPDVVVSDLEMPDGSGLDFIRRLRCRPVDQGGATPAIALTAHNTVLDQTRALLAGFQVHIGKPARVDALVRAIETVLRRDA